MLWHDGRIVWGPEAHILARPTQEYDAEAGDLFYGPYYQAFIDPEDVVGFLDQMRNHGFPESCTGNPEPPGAFGEAFTQIELAIDGTYVPLYSRRELFMQGYRAEHPDWDFEFSPEGSGKLVVREGQSYEDWLQTLDPEFTQFYQCWDAIRDALYALIPDEDSDVEIEELGMIRFHSAPSTSE